MIDRRDVATWLEGPPTRHDGDTYPGERLGLPAEGPGSVARFGRRAAALLVDGVSCQLVAMAFFGYRQGEGGPGTLLPTAVFLTLHLVLVATGGYTFGHRLLGLRVVRVDGGWAGPGPALIRTLCFALLIPVFVVDRDQRGLHDVLAGTVLVRTR